MIFDVSKTNFDFFGIMVRSTSIERSKQDPKVEPE